MTLLLTGFSLLVASVSFHVGVGLLPLEVQQFAKLVCIFAGMSILFSPRKPTRASQPKLKDALVAFSILVPIGIVHCVYSNFITLWMPNENTFDKLYLFLLWATLLFALLPLWGYVLLRIKFISPDDAAWFQTWRIKTTNAG